MARVRDISELPQYMDEISRAVRRGNTRIVKTATNTLGRTVVSNTPVDTGTARSNWIATLDQPTSVIIPAYRPFPKAFSGRETVTRFVENGNRSQAIAQITATSARFKTPRNKRIILQNNVPYIGLLNSGFSRQSPGVFVELGVQQAIATVARLKLVEGRDLKAVRGLRRE